ncbi:MAG: DUF1636 domain-containing protein [Rhodobacteraceae bacterium]|nr:DUF1636 domain-containing protein [Paracoccaceae bacterium]
MTTFITICDTCKREGWNPEEQSQTDGELLAALVESAAETVADVETRRHSCLMGCTHGCNIAIQSEGKLTYVLGRFAPEQEAAESIAAYAALHAKIESGQVPFKKWPQAIKGHFVSRIPVLPGQAD